jgi:hypothetical protein
MKLSDATVAPSQAVTVTLMVWPKKGLLVERVTVTPDTEAWATGTHKNSRPKIKTLLGQKPDRPKGMGFFHVGAKRLHPFMNGFYRKSSR